LIQQLCILLQSQLSDEQRNATVAALHNALKLFTDAVVFMHRRPSDNIWSPRLVQYLAKHPDKCDLVLEIIAEPEYEDRYYDRNFP
jgi:hypothetical protein